VAYLDAEYINDTGGGRDGPIVVGNEAAAGLVLGTIPGVVFGLVNGLAMLYITHLHRQGRIRPPNSCDGCAAEFGYSFRSSLRLVLTWRGRLCQVCRFARALPVERSLI
jgi:hypothetical protein